MATIKVSLPGKHFDGSEEKGFSVLFKALLVKAVNDGAKPDLSYARSKNTVSFNINLADNYTGILKSLLIDYPMAKVGDIAAAMVYAGQDKSEKLVPINKTGSTDKDRKKTGMVQSESLEAYMGGPGKTKNKEQVQLVSEMLIAMQDEKNNNPILLAEASTGIGKGAVMVAAAIDTANANSTPAVVSAPSFRVLNQLIKEHRAIEALTKETPLVLLYGKQEFVSEIKCNHYIEKHLSDPDHPEAVLLQDWLDRGAPDVEGQLFKRKWSVAGLLSHCSTVDASIDARAFKLENNTSKTDKGLIAYYRQFDHAGEAKVIYCTHAMLSTETITQRYKTMLEMRVDSVYEQLGKEVLIDWLATDKRKPLFVEQNNLLEQICAETNTTARIPEFHHLFIDEAHLFEQNLSQRASKSFAMYHLYLMLKKVSGISKEVSAYHFILEKIKSWANTSRANPAIFWINTIEQHQVLQALLDILKAIGKKTNNKKNINFKDDLLFAENTVRQILSFHDKKGLVSYVNFSPVFEFPSLHVGSSNVGRELDFLWRNKKVVLMSATLYVPSSKSDNDNRYLSDILSISHSRLKTMAPIRPSWVYSPVTLAVVHESLSQFTRPKYTNKDYTEKDAHWHTAVADYIEKIAENSVGGILVLNTSYDSIKKLTELLERLTQQNRLVFSSANEKIEFTKDRFELLSQQGMRPVWLATGQSWTGVDISGRVSGEPYDPSQDDVITDLIIPRLPFGLNRSISHIKRVSRHFASEYFETVIMLIQGMGRAIRSDGLKNNRTIHLLDQRINTKDSHLAALRIMVGRVLSRYKKRVLIR